MHEVSISVKNAHRDAQRFVQEYPLEKQGLLLIGSIGVGKTHLAVGMIQALIQDKGVPCLFCDYRELLKEIQNSYNPAVQATELEILRPMCPNRGRNYKTELGAVKSSEWVWDTVSFTFSTAASGVNRKPLTSSTTNFPDTHQSAASGVEHSERNPG